MTMSGSFRTHRELERLLASLYGELEGKVYRVNYRDWNKVESISVGPREYLILYRQMTGDPPLTPRERAAVRLAMGGATNKEIAWAFNVSASTVGVFLWRAARKLGVARDSLFRAFAERYSEDSALRIEEWQSAQVAEK
jgi:DNA-binding CsgD family transcriptional regulator